MRNTIVRFPSVRPDANATPADATSRLTCRWLRSPATGRLEQRWGVAAPAAEASTASDPSDAAA